MNRDDFKYLSQVFSGKVLNLVKQKGSCPLWVYDWFWKVQKKILPNKEKFFSSLTGKKISDKEYEHVLKV